MLIGLFFLSSGIFLGWSLGANHAANVFGTAVSTKMVRFSTAAWVCAVCVTLGAVISGAGASHTLGKLGAVNQIAGSFTVAISAALTVFWMTKAKLPVSTSQAIVGAIIGWNIFSGFPTDYATLTKIVGSWVISPILAGFFAVLLYLVIKRYMNRSRIHLLRLDTYTRRGLIIAGIFGSYSLGANNIANVMGVFVPASPFRDISVSGCLTITSTQQLFFLGAVAIGVGVFTYSRNVIHTVGSDIFKLNPVCALIVVLSSSLVLFLFASQGLKNVFTSVGLPSLPLVPMSSSQAVVGSVLGIGLAKSFRNIHFGILGRIGLGWIATPIMAGILSLLLLFIMQNVFMQQVFIIPGKP
jgi:PiT family inorganic phosphate transporter